MKQTTKKKTSKGILVFFENEAEHLRDMGHSSVANHYDSTRRSLERYLHTLRRKDVTMRRVDRTLILGYEEWLRSEGLCRNTVSFYMRTMQSAYSKAVQRGMTSDKHPFVGVYRGVARTTKRAVTMDDIRRLQDLDIRALLVDSGYKEDGRRFERRLARLQLARDMFLFCFCARGMAFVDMAYLRKENITGDVISYVRRKTHQRIQVGVEPMMRSIISRYASNSPFVFPVITGSGDERKMFKEYRSGISHYNVSLNMLSELLDGLKLSSYTCRHTWATVAHHLQVPLSVISQSLGHGSEQTTTIYLKSLECNVLNQYNHKVLESVFGGTNPSNAISASPIAL